MKSYVFNNQNKRSLKEINQNGKVDKNMYGEIYKKIEKLLSRLEKLEEDNSNYLEKIVYLEKQINKLKNEKEYIENKYRPFIVPTTITKEKVLKVKKLLKVDDNTIRVIAEKANVSPSTVVRIKQGRYNNVLNNGDE